MKRTVSFKNMPKLQAKKFARFRHEQKRRRLRGVLTRVERGLRGGMPR